LPRRGRSGRGEIPTAIDGKPDPADGPPCHLCPAACCRYFALEIDRPVTPRDYDQIRWFLVHENVSVWVQDSAWHLEVGNRCKYLKSDNRCGEYETRPEVCREYGSSGKIPCEYFNRDLSFDRYFDSTESFEVFARCELEKRKRRLARRRELYRRGKAERS